MLTFILVTNECFHCCPCYHLCVCMCVCVCNVKAEQYSYRIIYVDYNSGFRLYLYNRIKLEG